MKLVKVEIDEGNSIDNEEYVVELVIKILQIFSNKFYVED